MAKRPKTTTEAALAFAAREEKLRKFEERKAKGWTPPEPKEKVHVRAPDLLEEKDAHGRVQLTIFAAISKANGDARYEELQQFAPQAGRSRGNPDRKAAEHDQARNQDAKESRSQSESQGKARSEEQRLVDEWLTSALG